ncbi:uncharacterized protein [Linepithema humile]|uniref:uncharacterized protein isoform X2 n=1 Tax=Linepithema humile TaxID=83485 RepID=UPI00351EC709
MQCEGECACVIKDISECNTYDYCGLGFGLWVVVIYLQSESVIYIERRGNSTRHSKVHSLRDCKWCTLLIPATVCLIFIPCGLVDGNSRPYREDTYHNHERALTSAEFFSPRAISIMKLTLFTSAEEEYDYEEEAAAPVTSVPTKPAGGRLGGLLSSRGRTNIANIGKKKPTVQSTTSKPIEQAPEEDEIEGEDMLEENEEHKAPTTTTEPSTKKLRNNSGVRPFRSNEDLLAALKRRRAQTGSSSHPRETSTIHSAVEHTTAKSKAVTNSRSKASTSGETKTSGRARFGGRGSKTVQEEVEETQREEIQVKPKASSYRRSG